MAAKYNGKSVTGEVDLRDVVVPRRVELAGVIFRGVFQAEGAAFIIVYNAIATFIILKVISLIVPLRMDDAMLKIGDDAVHGETAYAIGTEGD